MESAVPIAVFTGPLKRRGGVQILLDLGYLMAETRPVIFVTEETVESKQDIVRIDRRSNIKLLIREQTRFLPMLGSVWWTMKVAWQLRHTTIVASAPQSLLPIWVAASFGRNIVYLVQGVEVLGEGLKGLLLSRLAILNFSLPVKKRIALSESIHQELKQNSVNTINGFRPWLSQEFLKKAIIPRLSERKYDFALFYTDSFLKGGDRLQPLVDRFPNNSFVVFSVLKSKDRLERSNLEWCTGLNSNDIKAKLLDVKMLISISRYEGFGLTVEEALISGCAVIGFYNRGLKNFYDFPLFLGVITNYGDIERAAERAKSIEHDCVLKQSEQIRKSQHELPRRVVNAICS